MNGCCVTGTVSGGQSGWNTTGCVYGTYYSANWERTLTDISHSSGCVHTFMQSCVPCGFAPFQTGNCPTPPRRSASVDRHKYVNNNNVIVYDHTWGDGPRRCACGVHDCLD
jgi:hypothetical protein